MLKTLFVPKGELRPYEFLKGCLILFVLQCAIYLIGMVGLASRPEYISALFSIIASLTALLIYPYFCLYGKRLSYLGLSRLWFVPITICFMLSVQPLYSLGASLLPSVVGALIDIGVHDRYLKLSFVVFGMIPLIVFAYTATIVTGLILGFSQRPDVSSRKLSAA